MNNETFEINSSPRRHAKFNNRSGSQTPYEKIRIDVSSWDVIS